MWNARSNNPQVTTMYFNPKHTHLGPEFAVLVKHFIYLPDEDLAEAKTCTRNTSDK
jgi:hypothetical protein